MRTFDHAALDTAYGFNPKNYSLAHKQEIAAKRARLMAVGTYRVPRWSIAYLVSSQFT